MKFKVLALAAALAAATPSFADTVTLSDYTFGPASKVTVSSPDYSGRAGQFTGLLNGNSFVTYCTDLLQNLKFDVEYTDYSVVSGVTAWGAAKSADLDRAMSAFALAGYPVDANTSAAAQSIIWEILYETSGSYDFSAGSFQVSSSNAGLTTVLGQIDWSDLPSVPIVVHADQLFSPTRQDLLVVTVVPEPGTYALMLAGLAGIGFVAQRRSRAV